MPSDETWAPTIAAALTPWFIRHQRDLSFRRTRDPWAIWIAEVMLQQTRVETVERYFPAFVQRFPDVQALAAADESAVLSAWSGLGYYRRARLLHRGARWVAEQHGGRVPHDAAALRAIPGVGAYTAGAIGSIAFDRPAPLVDGNVARVLSRLLAIDDPKAQGASARAHWQRVEAVLRSGRPRILAQALMELGATVCTPKSPRCDACPVATHCRARALDRVATIPAKKPKKTLPVDRFAALAITCRGRRLFVRRPASGLLADLWCLPLVPLPTAIARPSVERVREIVSGELALMPSHAMVRHVFTHRIWELHVVCARASSRPRLCDVAPDRLAWLPAGALPHGGIPTLTRKLLATLP